MGMSRRVHETKQANACKARKMANGLRAWCVQVRGWGGKGQTRDAEDDVNNGPTAIASRGIKNVRGSEEYVFGRGSETRGGGRGRVVK